MGIISRGLDNADMWKAPLNSDKWIRVNWFEELQTDCRLPESTGARAVLDLIISTLAAKYTNTFLTVSIGNRISRCVLFVLPWLYVKNCSIFFYPPFSVFKEKNIKKNIKTQLKRQDQKMKPYSRIRKRSTELWCIQSKKTWKTATKEEAAIYKLILLLYTISFTMIVCFTIEAAEH